MSKAHPFGYRAYHELAKEYGDIMSVKVGLQEMGTTRNYQSTLQLGMNF